MEEDEEDRLLLSRLGITSANPKDIEHELLRKVETHSTPEDKKENENPSQDAEDLQSNIRSKLYSRLQAVKTEIDAVAASIDNSKTTEENVADASTHGNIDIENDLEHRDDSNQVTSDGFSVQHALAVDRLKSLKRTKAKLQNEIARLDESVSTESIENSSLIEKLVKETPKSRKLKESQSSESTSYLKRKSVAYEDDDDFDAVLDATSTGFVETEREKMVRKGLMTPFHKLRGLERRVQVPPPQTVSNPSYIDDDKSEHLVSSSIAKAASAMSNMANARSSTKLLDANSLPTLDGPTRPFHRLKTPLKHPISPTDDIEKKQKVKRSKRPLPGKKWRANVTLEDRQLNEAGVDESDNLVDGDYDGQVEGYADDGESSVIIEGGFKIPGAIYNQLFDYQKVGVQWLWELHCQRAGGIIGDEMGLGKTIQVISFLAALHFSNMYKPSIVICPVTLLRQWQREARKWYPKFHVEILHDSAHGLDKRSIASSSGSDDDSEKDSPDSKSETPSSGRSIERWNYLLDRVLNSNSGLLLTSYEQLRILGEKLLDIEWGYAILDEGHRIRNPNAEVTLVCKQLQTVHRIIMTGAPIQNKLSELWSLFDFIFPGKLGVLPVFEREFAVPITVGGYANATPLQVSTAYRCAVVLRDLIMPYLLRRMKADVNAHLPKKIEHVLFCSLTDEQRSTYRAFLASSEVEQIFDGRRNSLYGIDVMRKICNHPDLLEREYCGQHLDYGNPERSGKMKVVAQVLDVWKEQGHRVLIFSQTQQMLDILEKFLSNGGFIYRRMDGLTPVKQRMALIDEFNNSTEVFVFILTTKVGGLGTNLIGANRVIIYDPDWNPSTDMQARERAWRIGQTKDVTIYRLITRGTIEEKVYHRQIYKHFLTNKILKNPKQRRFFKARDMRDLFTLQDDGKAGSTETSDIFSQLSGAVNVEVRDDTKGDTRGKEKLAAYGAGESKSEASVSGIPDRKGKEAANENGSSMDEETNVLKSLFGAQGIHSALNHDAIVDANDDDRLRLEEQASLVAQKAAEALRQSRIIRSQECFSVPTWTGKSGAAGAPSSVRRKFGSAVNSNLLGSSKVKPEGSSSGPGLIVGATTGKALSSAELLAKTRGNQENAINHAIEHQLGSSSRANAALESRAKLSSKLTVVQPEVLIRQLCTFIHQRGGSAESSIIVEHFKDRVPQKDLPLFRNLLKEIAALEKGADGSRWVLKAEYRE